MLKFGYFLFICAIVSLASARSIAASDLEFSVKYPYPFCISQLHKMDPEIPLSFFSASEAAKLTRSNNIQNTPDSCEQEMNHELLDNGLRDGIAFFLNSFPKVDRAIFADNLMRLPNHAERLKKLNALLTSCQSRTEAYHKLAAIASKDIYDQSLDHDSVPPGYELVNRRTDFFNFPETQVQAYLIRPKAPNPNHLPPIIAFRGTSSKEAWFADTSLGANQIKNVLPKFQEWVRTLHAEHYHELIVTGHSLGGGLAETSVGILKSFQDMNVHVVTFNGFGGVPATQSYAVHAREKVFNFDSKNFQATRDMVAYRMDHDVVSLIGEHFGQMRTLPSSYGKFEVLANHDIMTVLHSIHEQPHLLASLPPKTVVAPFAIGDSVFKFQATIQKVNSDLGDFKFDLTNSTCKEAFNDSSPHLQNSCTHLGGNARECERMGNLAFSNNRFNEALDKYKTGCDLCDKSSCMHYAQLNDKLGERYKAVWARDKACNLTNNMADVIKCEKWLQAFDMLKPITISLPDFGYDELRK